MIKNNEAELSKCENEIIEASKHGNGIKIESLSKRCHELEKEI